MLSPSGRRDRKCNLSYFVSDIEKSREQGTPLQVLQRKKYLKMRNGGPNSVSGKVMMMRYRLQEEAEVEGRREGET